jgi:hypothetical protein
LRVWTSEVSRLPGDHRVAVVIGETGPGQRHVGLAYRPTAASEPKFLHLAWHHDLRDDERVSSKYRCVLLADVPPALHPTIVAQCKLSAQADRRGLPYGFGYSPVAVSREEATGRLLLEGASGLTCATFVLAVLELANVRLAELGAWQDRDGDDGWKEWVIRQLEEDGASSIHVAAVRADRGHVRVRPEDVAGAASQIPIPAEFERATARGLEILSELLSVAPWRAR